MTAHQSFSVIAPGCPRRSGQLYIVASGLALALLVAVAACRHDRMLDPRVDVAALSDAIVSNPVANVGGAAFSGATTGGAVAYVSLPPGSLPNGEHVTIRNPRSGAIVAVVMVNGGFDPVAVGAVVGDTLDLEFRLAGSVSFVHASYLVPVRRGPIVVRTEPPPRRRDVPLNAAVLVVFSEPIDPQSVTATSVRLLRGGSPVSGVVALVPGSPFRVELIPDSPLEPLTDYELVVATAVRDLDGDALEEELRVEFTTEPLLTPPNPDFRFPPVSGNAVAYYRVSPSVIPGQSRYVLAEDGTFRLQYVRPDLPPDWMFFEYPGTYFRVDSVIEFKFDGWSIAGPWLAEGTLLGSSLTVHYNLIMSLSDFEDGVYLRFP